MSKRPLIQLSRRAEVALERLQAQDRRRISIALGKVVTRGLDSRSVIRLGEGASGRVGLIRAGKDLRIIFKKTMHGVEVLDIVRHDKLRHVHDTFWHEGGAV